MLKGIIRHNLGVYFIVLACLDFAFMGAIVKILSSDLSSIELIFFRNFIGFVWMIYLIKKIRSHKEGGKIWLLIFRGVAGALSLYLFFYNVANISLGGAFAFQKTAPIFITIISFILFKESVGWRGWLAILVAFGGVLLIAQPWASGEMHTGFDIKNSLLGVLSGLLAACALTSVRQLRHYYATEIIAFAFISVGTLMPVISMILGEFIRIDGLDFMIAKFIWPSWWQWILILMMGALGTIYQIHVTKAYGIAKKAGIVAGVSYLDVVFSLVLGIILGDNFPSVMVFFGMAAIVCGGLGLVLRSAPSPLKPKGAKR